MFGGSKEAGAIVGQVTKGENGIDEGLDELLEATGVEESFRCTMENSDGEQVPCVLVSQLSLDDGAVLWNREDEQVILRRTVQMGQMVSMLHDRDRNSMYEMAIRVVVENFKDKVGRRPSVLDVGCGTGLLSCLAATAGAMNVLGCEMFDLMAQIATQVVEDNGLDDKINILAAKSPDLEVLNEDRFDILVSELLDSALLGESVMFSHSDAISRLIKRDGDYDHQSVLPISQRVIPHSATMFATLVECLEIHKSDNVDGIKFGSAKNGTPFRSEDARHCQGGRSVIPVHWQEMKQRGEGGRELSKPTQVIDFEFYHEELSTSIVQSETLITTTLGGSIHGVLMHWDVNLVSPDLDPESKIRYSTAADSNQNWQDHWVQTIHVLPVPIMCSKGTIITLTVYHNNLQIWVEVKKVCSAVDESGEAALKRIRRVDETQEDDSLVSQCQCGWHLLDSPFRICSLNDRDRRSLWERAVQCAVKLSFELESDKGSDYINDKSKSRFPALILDVSDESVLALTAAHNLKELLKQGEDHLTVVSKERKLLALLHYQQLAIANDVDGILNFWYGNGTLEDFVQSLVCHDGSQEEEDEADDESALCCKVRIAALVCECFFYQMQARPIWSALAFLYQRIAVQHHCDSRTIFLPCESYVVFVAFELTDLVVSHGQAGVVSGFDHSSFDQVIDGWEKNLFPYKLSDYRKKKLSEPVCIATINYRQGEINCIQEGLLTFTCDGSFDCVAVFVNYSLGFDLPLVDMLDATYVKHNILFMPNPQCDRKVNCGTEKKWVSTFLQESSEFSLAFC